MDYYNLIPYKEYEIYCHQPNWFIKNTQSNTMVIDKNHIEMYFKPLSEIRNNKINRILHEEDKDATL
jgi:hypothetical protein